MKVRDADNYLIRGAAVMKLGTGDQKIRISAEGYKVKETTLLNVPRGGGSYNVALELL